MNILDTNNQRLYAFPSMQLGSKLITRNIGIPYFDPNNDHKFRQAVLGVYAMGRCVLENWPPTDTHRVLAAVESVAPGLPEDRFLQAAPARAMFVRSIVSFLVTNGHDSRYTKEPENVSESTDLDVRAAQQRIPAANYNDNQAILLAILGRNEGAVIVDEDFTIAVAQAVAIYADALCSENSTAKGRALGTNLYVIGYVGAAKRGQITNQKIGSINRAISIETNMDVDVSVSEIESFARATAGCINSQNAEQTFRRMGEAMANRSLRLRVIMMQVARSGMTAYWCIIEAIRMFPTFPWPQVARFISADFVNFIQAVAVVQGDEYYGFRADLGVAKHTKYKSLAWVCFKLLQKYKAAEYGSLGNYQGYGAPDHAADLAAIIEAFRPPVGQEQVANLEATLTHIRQWRLNEGGNNN